MELGKGIDHKKQNHLLLKVQPAVADTITITQLHQNREFNVHPHFIFIQSPEVLDQAEWHALYQISTVHALSNCFNQLLHREAVMEN